MNMIAIQLTKPEADLFVQFQRYHNNFQKLIDSGALDVKAGKVVLHFDSEGNIRKIERNDTMFSS